MTVKELIDHLSTFDPTLSVMTSSQGSTFHIFPEDVTLGNFAYFDQDEIENGVEVVKIMHLPF